MKQYDKGVHVLLNLVRSERRLTATVSVEDPAMRAVAPGFDSCENVFALLPREEASGGVTWVRHEFPYQYSWRDGAGGDEALFVVHGGVVEGADADPDAILKHGVAMGVTTNIGVLWLQTDGDNYQPRVS